MKVITREQVLSKIIEIDKGREVSAHVTMSISGCYVSSNAGQISQKGLTLCRANAILLSHIFADKPLLVIRALADLEVDTQKGPSISHVVSILEQTGVYYPDERPHGDSGEFSGEMTALESSDELSVDIERTEGTETISISGEKDGVVDALRVIFGEEQQSTCSEPRIDIGLAEELAAMGPIIMGRVRTRS